MKIRINCFRIGNVSTVDEFLLSCIRYKSNQTKYERHINAGDFLLSFVNDFHRWFEDMTES